MDIKTVLAKVDLSAIEGAFSITFIKADGSIRNINRASKVQKKNRGGASDEGSGFKYKIKEKGVILIQDLDATDIKDMNKTIKISRITHFNGQKVTH